MADTSDIHLSDVHRLAAKIERQAGLIRSTAAVSTTDGYTVFGPNAGGTPKLTFKAIEGGIWEGATASTGFRWDFADGTEGLLFGADMDSEGVTTGEVTILHRNLDLPGSRRYLYLGHDASTMACDDPRYGRTFVQCEPGAAVLGTANTLLHANVDEIVAIAANGRYANLTGLPTIRVGRQSVSLSANVVTSLSVSFAPAQFGGSDFSAPPIVTVTPEVADPSTVWCAVQSATSTGFVLRIKSSLAATIAIHYQAIGN